MSEERYYFQEPEHLLDNEGYPTEETLEYLKNWCMWMEDGEVKMGQFFRTDCVQDLINFLKQIWYYDDGIVQHDKWLEIHTVGWSGNEEIVEVLKGSILWWMNYFDMMQAGGHYYFKLDKDDHFSRTIDYMFKDNMIEFINWQREEQIDSQLDAEGVVELFKNRKQ